MPFSIPVVVLFISSVGWGLTWIPIQWFSQAGLPSPIAILLAFGSVTLVLVPLAYRQRSQWLSHFRLLLLIALFGGLANLTFQTAMYYGDVVRVMILFYLLPVWSVLGGRFFLGERIDWIRSLAMLAAVSGAFLILGGTKLLETPPGWIDVLALLSGLTFSMNNLVFRYSEAIPLTTRVFAMFAGTSLLVSLFLLSGFDEEVVLSTKNVSVAVAYGLGWLALITYGTQWPISLLEAGKASIIIVMELVVAVLSSVILLQQSLAIHEIAGILLVVAAAVTEGIREEKIHQQG